MPFQSRKQAKKCFALRARGQAKGWDCEEFARHTDYPKLPERKKAAALARAMAGALRGDHRKDEKMADDQNAPDHLPHHVPGGTQALQAMASPQDRVDGGRVPPSPAPTPSPGAPGHSGPPHGRHVPQAPSHSQHGPAQALAALLKDLAGRGHMRPEPPQPHETAKQAGDRRARNALRKVLREKTAAAYVRAARRRAIDFLDGQAAAVPVEKRAAAYAIMAELSRGRPLSRAIAAACPHLKAAEVHDLAQKIVAGVAKRANLGAAAPPPTTQPMSFAGSPAAGMDFARSAIGF